MGSQKDTAVRFLSLGDIFVIAVVLAWCVRDLPVADPGVLFPLLVVVPLTQYLLRFFGVYESHRLSGLRSVVPSVISAILCAFFVVAHVFVIAGGWDWLPPLIAFAGLAALSLVAMRLALYTVLRWVRRRGVDERSVCVIGSWEKAAQLASQFAGREEWGLRVGFVGEPYEGALRFLRYPSGQIAAESLEGLLHGHVIDEVLIAAPPEEIPRYLAVVSVCEKYGILGRILLPKQQTPQPEAAGDVSAGRTLNVSGNHDREAAYILKRLVDASVAFLMLMALAAPMAFIALLVKLSSPGPVLFRQRRVGLRGRRFTIYKFRTMVEGAEAMLRPANNSITRGPVFKDPRDYRVTNVGFFLRKYSLDELPQLFNVLKGEMSLVGPRPLPVAEAGAITGENRRRFSVPPGLTGIWQVSGRSNVDFSKWMKLDLQYVDGWSLGLDAKLLLKTIPAVISGRGAY